MTWHFWNANALRHVPGWLHWGDLPWPWSQLAFELSRPALLALAALSILAAGLAMERSFRWVSLLRTAVINLALITLGHYSIALFPWLLRPVPGDPYHKFLIIPGVLQVGLFFSTFLVAAYLGCVSPRRADEFERQGIDFEQEESKLVKPHLWVICGVALCRGALLEAAAPPSSEVLRNADGANDTFSAVGQFRGPRTCTATLIDPSGRQSADARAWLLTAGHCINLDPYRVIRSEPLRAQVTFNFFIDTPDRRVVVNGRATGWSTMKGADLALIELDTTLGDLSTRGIRPLRLTTTSTVAGSPVFWTGIPLNPIPPGQQFLRRGRCTQGNHVQLIESSWIWHDDMSNDCPDLYAGASGSPLFDAVSGDIIGVIGTGTLLNFEEGPDFDCQINRPCVMNAGGPLTEKNTGYASPVPNIAPCFDQTNALDLQRPGCTLDPGYQLGVNSGANEVQPVTDGKPAAWDTALTGTQRYYAYKRFAAGEGNCTNPSGYGEPIAVATAPVIRDPIGSTDGYYFLCVISGDTPVVDSSWQKPAHASARFKRIDSQPPVVPLDYEVEVLPVGYHLLFTSGGEAPSGLGPAFYKMGPLAAMDCSDPRDYRVQISIPPIIRPSEFPTRLCWKSSDKAGNLTTPVAFDFGPPAIFPNAIQNGASLQRGAVTPGGIFRVDTFNLTMLPNTLSPLCLCLLEFARPCWMRQAGHCR